MRDLREACAAVAERAEHVSVVTDAIPGYAASLPTSGRAPDPPAPAPDREQAAATWLIMDAVNFGSGWFPTLRKRPGLSGSTTIATALRERFDATGPWPAGALTELSTPALALVLEQDPAHELMGYYAASLRDLGRRVADGHGGSFAAVVDRADGSAVALARTLGSWACFADCSRYGGLELPFLKRAQIAAADLHRAGVAAFGDLDGLTMFADNLVPHVLRLDGVLRFTPSLVARIEREELIEHGSPEEIEIRACAVHAVELIVAAGGGANAATVDELLWHRGQAPHYKASPRHRSRCTAY